MIEAVGTLFGQEGINQVALEREKQMLSRYQNELESIDNLTDKISKLVSLRESDGYMAEMQITAEGTLLIENHCPICKAATSCPTLCQSELNVFQSLFGDDVHIERTEHIINDERRCVYLITQN